ncbi:4-hydroxybenzoate polyprenyltransferase [Microbacterium sp. SORGH_AS 1204]|uniref:SCO3242 family prenyltransferase n=1 Tax=Microbacterium sp. SORGH_AS_1204 TaxID=3041785 RepID=UPI002790620C|nr:UbiA family prenyltransferase [Microbacterium sp. SORGH_AS_1204]MDQ1135585.1 4-hydroxybenzoate polyprenyltransferase [Microbacterium sp. SORGH_AS_1204]
MTRVADYLDLVRAPASLTVLGDALVGALSARRPGRESLACTGALATSSVCLYSAGMALNDWADADLDALERPERPIPSGRITRSRALAVGAGLTVVGVGSAFAAGRASGAVSLALAGALWAYDLVFKSTAAGPVVMAVCRGLDVMMGASGPGWRGALLPASAVAVHTIAVTAVSRGEVDGSTRVTGGAAVAASVAVAASALAGSGDRAAAALGGARYLSAVLPGYLAVADDAGAANARNATRAGIRAVVPLQSALAARAGSPIATIALLGVEVVGRLLGRRRSRGDIT